MMGRRIIITGSRDWDDPAPIHAVLDEELAKTPQDQWLIVVHGGARGADTIAGKWAYDQLVRGRRVRYEQFCADWDGYGKRAGMLRNVVMIGTGAEVCHAFPKGQSRGTRHCMAQARRAGISVIDHGQPE